MFGRSKRIWGSLVAAAALCFSSTGLAVTQPNGMTVPWINAALEVCHNENVEICIDEAEGDASLIDTQVDALIAPETFQPTCQLTFTPVVKGGTIADAFGWYNVKEDAAGKPVKPTVAELYGMFVATGFKDPPDFVGQAVVLDLNVEAAAGRYKGGQIAFFLVSTDQQLGLDPITHRLLDGQGMPLMNTQYQFHTQHALNVGSTPTSTTYNVLTWESVAKKNTFYFGWEDLPPNSQIDNDFDDFVFSVSGVQCGGGGQPCETGNLGVCTAGVLQCKKSVITCVQTLEASAEACNALDDDCNGIVDDGEELCAAGEVCDRGVCTPRCGTGEFRCPANLVCTTGGLCVDAACKTVECEAGKVCSAGECVDSCTGIVCPHDRVCRNGGCVDPCVGIECDEGFACVLGICTSCDCAACGAGLVCHDRECVDTGCEAQTCADGTHCSLGACVDNCEGTVCPQNQVCSGGECIADGTNPSGGSSGAGVGGGLQPLGGKTGNPGAGGNGSGGKATGRPLDVSEPACGCEVPGRQTSRAGLLVLALAGLAWRRRAARSAAGKKAA